jgi:hypothetical protein
MLKNSIPVGDACFLAQNIARIRPREIARQRNQQGEGLYANARETGKGDGD